MARMTVTLEPEKLAALNARADTYQIASARLARAAISRLLTDPTFFADVLLAESKRDGVERQATEVA